MWPNPFFAKINTQSLTWKKVALTLGVILQSLKNAQNYNRPVGEKSPNLVNLAAALEIFVSRLT
jgi:hypothetical protein